MSNQSNQTANLQDIANADLFRQVMESGQNGAPVYPWMPEQHSEQTFDFFNTQEQEAGEGLVATTDLLTEQDSQGFFAFLDQQWAKVAPSRNLLAELSDRFANLPQLNLDQMLTKAQQLAKVPGAAIDQLVACVQEMMPSLDLEDLQVMARPYALAMRSQEAPKQLPRNADWSKLSEVERGRLAMAIAHWMMAEIKHNQGEA
jgi:hypothetical protein